MVKTVAIICTSSGELGGHKTGVWLEELAAAYYIFKDASLNVIVASVKGGAVPLDAASLSGGFFTEAAKKFMHDAEAVGALSHSVAVSDIKVGDVDALFFAGGHGTCVDFPQSKELSALIEATLAQKKVVAAVCHGPMVFVGPKNPDGTPIVNGKTISAFTDAEEKAVGLEGKVPFLLESKLRSLGAKMKTGEMWHSCTSSDGLLISGQNPQSTSDCAKLLVGKLE